MGTSKRDAVDELGADLRDHFNNRLQEIRAMVHVAREAHNATRGLEALEHIDRTAASIARAVNGLEEKIRKAVNG